VGKPPEFTRGPHKRSELSRLGLGMTFIFDLEHDANDDSGLTIELSGARAGV